MWNLLDNQDVGLEAAIIQRVRNSSLVKRFCAQNHRGSSVIPKLGVTTLSRDGRRAFHALRRRTVRTAGADHGREYAGISNDKTGEKPVRRKSKVSWGRLIRPGLVGS